MERPYGCATPEPSDLAEAEPLQPRMQEEEEPEVIPEVASPPPITVRWLLGGESIEALPGESPEVAVRVASTAQETALVAGVWTVEYAGVANHQVIPPFALEPGGELDLSLELAAMVELEAAASAPGAAWVGLRVASGGQVFFEGEEGEVGWIHPGTESLRFWTAADEVFVAQNRILSQAQAEGQPGAEPASLYPGLGADDLEDLDNGSLVEIVQWVPPSADEEALFDVLTEQLIGEEG